jgi:hypothetical protein
MTHPVTRLFLWGFILLITIALLLDYKSAVGMNSHGESNAEVAHFGQEFKLRVGEQVGFDGDILKVKFLSVGGDSRCPKDVTCIWVGNAEVLLEMSENEDITIIKLNTYRGFQSPKEGKYLGYKVELIDLSPYPSKGKRIGSTDYVVTLVVSKD